MQFKCEIIAQVLKVWAQVGKKPLTNCQLLVTEEDTGLESWEKTTSRITKKRSSSQMRKIAEQQHKAPAMANSLAMSWGQPRFVGGRRLPRNALPSEETSNRGKRAGKLSPRELWLQKHCRTVEARRGAARQLWGPALPPSHPLPAPRAPLRDPGPVRWFSQTVILQVCMCVCLSAYFPPQFCMFFLFKAPNPQ